MCSNLDQVYIVCMYVCFSLQLHRQGISGVFLVRLQLLNDSNVSSKVKVNAPRIN